MEELVSASGIIIVGSVPQGTVSGTTVTVSVHVERVLKGKSAPGAVVSAVGSLSQPWQTRAIGHDRAIFFLANASAGPMRLVPVTSGFVPDERWVYLPLPDATAPAASPATNSDAGERVLLEVLGGIEAGPLKQIGGFIDPEPTYRASPTPAARAVFRRWLTSGSPSLTAIALRALLGEADPTSLSLLAANPALRSAALDAHAFDGLRWYFHNADPARVRLLAQLAGDGANSMDLRVAAASALARVHTTEALPFLAQFLESTDPTVRGCGVGGLAMFANHVPIGSHEPAAGDWRWRTEETIAHSGTDGHDQDSVRFWKNWWVANHTALSE